MEPAILNDNSAFYVAFWGMVFTAVIVGMIIYAIVAVVKSKHARDERWRAQNSEVPPLFEKMLEKAMAERDRKQVQLQHRIEVLERIVTDTHKSHSLTEEINKLRE